MRRNKKGFVLLIVLVIGLAAGMAAISLVRTAGSSTIASVSTTGQKTAEQIARAGLMRATEYLDALVREELDFDRALDPELTRNCLHNSGGKNLNQPRFLEPGVEKDVSYGAPGLEKKYTLVPFGGGAYLVRFDDDFDDLLDNPHWNRYTNNNPHSSGCSNCCPEGPSLPTHHQDNSYRDRNRSLFVTVVGVFPWSPGDDPNRAKFRAVLRRQHTFITPPTIPGINVKGNIVVEGNATLYGCSPIAGLQVGGDVEVKGSGRMCASGESNANQWVAAKHCTEDPYYDRCAEKLGKPPADGALMTPGTVPPSLGDPKDNADKYIDWSRPCIFYLDNNNKALWFWDANATRGPRAAPGEHPAHCSDLEGRDKKWPGPPRPEKSGVVDGAALNPGPGSADAWAGCWTPLILNMDNECNWAWHENNTGAPNEPNEAFTSGVCSWRPDNTKTINNKKISNTFPGQPTGVTHPHESTGSTMNALLLAAYQSTFPYLDSSGNCGVVVGGAESVSDQCDGLTWNKPAWAEACTVEYPPFPQLSQESTEYKCTTCDGNHEALSYNTHYHTIWYRKAGIDPTPNNLRAIPAGVYFISDDPSTPDYLKMDNSPHGAWPSSFWPIPATGQVPDPLHDPNAGTTETVYPLMTLFLDGNATLASNSSGDVFILGFGQTWAQTTGPCQSAPETCEGAHFPAIISNGHLTLQGGSNVAIVGSLYVDGDLIWAGNSDMYLFGEVYVTDNGDNFELTGSGDFFWLYSNAYQLPPPKQPSPPLNVFSVP